MAAKWAVEVINNQSLPHELNIGEDCHCQHHYHCQGVIIITDREDEAWQILHQYYYKKR